ncbi:MULTISPECIES: hypothetical protein [unclassified Microbacterium]|uniref:hypothetical protein n=1 Tax=unclassified Microbacterium TaxID=2609290 RepID=UPI00109BA998|nr:MULTISPECIES: hypothetical protein [unclassified Microbacterium]
MTELSPPTPTPTPPDRRKHVQPWWQPPEDGVPAILPIVAPIVRTSTAALTLVGAHVYREGVELLLERRMRRWGETDDEWQAKIREFLQTPDKPAVPGGTESLQYSIITGGEEVFANSLFRGLADVNEKPSSLSVMHTGSGASGDPWLCKSSEGLWLWTMPTVDHLELVVRWPAVGVSVASIFVQIAQLEEMSQRSSLLWETTP